VDGSSVETTIEGTFDALLLAKLHLRTVSVAYRTFFSDSPPPTLRELTHLWEERLADPTMSALAVSRGGETVGAVAVRQDPDFDSEGQLLGLHVLPDYWGQGFGSALHDRALLALSAQAYRTAGLWVIADNIRARRMYEERSWALRPGVELNYLGVREVRYVKQLRASSGAVPI
jgi:ribosomal protein S18 acetylase RimI-like enzyme